MGNFFYILKSLGIRFSFQYTKDLVLDQNGSMSLWGIKQLLQKYGVEITAVKVGSKSLDNISYPFVYQGEDGFYVMTRKPDNPEDFEKEWNGIALLCDTSKASEPYYLLHKTRDVITDAIPWIVISGALLLLVSHLTNPFSFTRALLAVFSIAGLYFSWKSAVNECSGSCSTVTGSPAGKIFGYSLSVIGMAWFGISVLTIALIPQWLPLWNLIAVIALAMPLWSILWQAFIIKAWCRNCLAVQAAVICCATTVIAGEGLNPDLINWRPAVALPSLFLIAAYALNMAFEYYKSAKHPPQDIAVLNMMSNPQLRDHIINMGKKVDTSGIPELWALNPDGENKVFIALSLRCQHCKNMFAKILEAQRKGRLSRYHITFAVNGTGQDKSVVEVLAATSVLNGSPAALELLAQWYDHQNPKAFKRLASKILPMDGIMETLDTIDNNVTEINVTELPFVALNGHAIAPVVFWADVELKN